MKKIKIVSIRWAWLMAMGLSGVLSACGQGSESPALAEDPIPPEEMVLPVVPIVPVVPPSTVLAVTAVTPLPNAAGLTINTQFITAAFNKPIDVGTLNPETFTLACPSSDPIGGGVVTYIAASQIAILTLPSGTVLPANTSCHATVTTAVADSTGATLPTRFVWYFGTGAAPDTTAPTVTHTNNANGVGDVAVNAKIGATFSEAMNPLSINNSSFTLKQGNTLVSGAIGYAGISMVFVPTRDLMPNTTYTATITTQAVDLAGNPLDGDYVWHWTTAPAHVATDRTAPTVSQTVIANGSSNVPVNTSVGATFSEVMNPLTISNSSFTLQETHNGTKVAGSTSYSGVNALFVPSTALVANTSYTATLTTMAADLAGNPMEKNYSWHWTTALAADHTRPTVTSTIQTNGATDVALNSRIGVTFSEALNPLTLNNVNFTLKQTLNGTSVVGTTSYAGTEAVFTPSSPLLAATQYTALIKGGATGVEDQAANTMTSDYTWRWTTKAAADTTAPVIESVNPTEFALHVPVTSAVSVTFSEAMNPLSIHSASFKMAGVAGVVSFHVASKVATFTPSAALTAGTAYTVRLTREASDLAGNALVADKTWTFSTEPVAVVVPQAAAIPLNSAASYGLFGGTAGLTNTGIFTHINGDIGTTATGTSMLTGFHDNMGDIYTETPANIGGVNGKIYTCTNSTTGPTSTGVKAPACVAATQARRDAQTAYLALVARPVGGASPAPGANLAGVTLQPGTYVAPGGAFMIQGGNLTLDAQGNPNAIWVFQMATTLTVGGPGAAFPQSIILAGGATAKNVFWQVGSFATINAAGGGTMVGNIISQAGASFSTAGNVAIATLNGRVLSLGPSVTLVNTVINVPQ